MLSNCCHFKVDIELAVGSTYITKIIVIKHSMAHLQSDNKRIEQHCDKRHTLGIELHDFTTSCRKRQVG